MSAYVTGTYRPGRLLDGKGFLIRGAGKHAMLMPSPDEGMVLAQFDDHELPEAYGWHPFPAAHFVLDPDWDSKE
jgi:hypothetical protein